MLVANRNLQSVSTGPGKKSTKEWIASALAVGSGPHIAHWNPLSEVNRMANNSKESPEYWSRREENVDSSTAWPPPDSGRAPLEPAHREESNGIRLEVPACL